MKNDFTLATIRKMGLRSVLLSVATIVIVFICIGGSYRYLYNMLLGPFPINKDEILNLDNPASRLQYYVSVTGDDHADTGYSYVNTSNTGKETVEANYHVLLMEGSLLLVKSKLTEIPNQITGALITMPSGEKANVISKIEVEVPQLKGAFLPVMLDATNFKTGGYIGLAVAAIVIILAMWRLVVGTNRYFHPELHPALKKLEAYGKLETVINDIDLNMSAVHTQVGKKVHFTNRWLVTTANTAGGFAAMPYRDIIWSFKRVIQHRTNGIPTGKSFTANIFDRFGKQMIIQTKEVDVEQILQSISKCASGSIVGWSEALNNGWKNDRAALIAAVDARRP